ncbi:MAG TPA: COX15/CtaA family protein [Streptosporangiaceae bacterium]|nr:COX15/CtaA family protein [Streptosporangiaceae bacterium]
MPPSALVISGIVSVQVGAGLAGRLFGQVSPAAMTGLRLWAAAVLLAAFGARGLARSVRGLARERAWRDGAVVAAFGVTLGIMNFSIYQAMARIPLGIAVTIEFLGPLAVAVASSRRLIDLLWVGLAGAGVALLSDGWASLAHGAGPGRSAGSAGLVLAGVAFALVSAAGWAAYIMLSAATGRRFPGSSGLTIAMVVAALAVTPTAIASAGHGAGLGGTTPPRPPGAGLGGLLRPGILATGVAVALLSSVIPYQLELETLRRIPARIFGIWMSLEPAVAALIGLIMLGQALVPREWAAIGCVVAACAGAARGSAAGRRPANDPSGLAGPGPVRDTRTVESVPGPVAPPRGDTGGSAANDGAANDGAATPGARLRERARGLAAPVLAPSPAWMRRISLAGVVASAGIIMTGAGVRLSDSGLGCPDWPRCTAASIIAGGDTGDPLIHRWIEFGNRLVTVAIFVVAIVVCVAAWNYRPDGDGRRRKDVLWLAAAQPAAIVAQAVLGGILVLTKLDPVWVSVHFLASMAMVVATMALYVRCAEARGPTRLLVSPEVRRYAFGAVAVLGLMIAVGTVVTGTGPLAGAGRVRRFNLPLGGVTQLHADIGWLLAGLVIALAIGLRLLGAPPRAVRLAWTLVGLVGLQGVIGYAQYFSGLPAGLVWVHVTGAVLIWITAIGLLFALRDRGSVLAAPPGTPATEPTTTEPTASQPTASQPTADRPTAGEPAAALSPDARRR